MLTVYNIFRKFQRDGVWEAIWAELHMALRERMGREASPSAAVLDSRFAGVCASGAGQPPLPTRLVAGLFILKMGYSAGRCPSLKVRCCASG